MRLSPLPVAIAVAALALLAAPSTADDEDEPRGSRVFADVVARARESGALERALGTHRFAFTRTYYDEAGEEEGGLDMLMTYRIGVLPEEDAIRVRVEVYALERGVVVKFAYVVGLADGALRRLDSTFPYGYVRARVRDGKIHVVRDLRGGTGEGKEEGSYDWDDRTLPKVVGLFILPMLHDQGLPDSFAYRDFDPFGALRPAATIRAAGRHAESGHLVYASEEGRQQPSTTVRVPTDGAAAHLLHEIRTISDVHVHAETKKETVAHLALAERITREAFAERLPRFSPPPEEDEEND